MEIDVGESPAAHQPGIAALNTPPTSRKRKHKSEGDIERLNLAPWLRRRLHPSMLSPTRLRAYQEFHASSETGSSRAATEPQRRNRADSLRGSESSENASQASLDYFRPSRLSFPKGPCSPPLSLTAWAEVASRPDSLNSCRPPDPVRFTDRMPEDITKIPAFLFKPRPPPTLPPHILAYTFDRVLRKYRRLAKLVDDYQRWHGQFVFAFWTREEVALAKSGEAPAFTKALEKDRPSISPRILSTRFDIVLLAAPVLSHLIERYHKDLGADFFAFYPSDPRGPLQPRDSPPDYSRFGRESDDDWEVFMGLKKLAEDTKYAYLLP